MPNELEHNLSHSRAAYGYAIQSLPVLQPGQHWPVRHGNFEFTSASHVESMQIEFGWAFFCRYKGCVEAFLKKNGVELGKKKTLKDWLKERTTLPTGSLEPLELYRKIRNQLHHEDGASWGDDPTSEIHLLPEDMEKFYGFFVWLGEQVLRHKGEANRKET